jgi:hypothetical protein
MSVVGVTAGLHAAFLLARGRADGVVGIRAEPEDAARSFVALAVAAPALMAVRLLAWSSAAGVPANAPRLLAHELLVFAVAWMGFVVLSHRITMRLGRGALWPRFVLTYNWCNVVAVLMALAASVPAAMGAPRVVDQVAQLVAMGWALWLGWVAVRLTLRTGPLLALYFVVLEQLVGLSFTVAGAAFLPK